MPTITLDFDVTTNQQAKLDRWFIRWNASLPVPHATLEDALKDILVSNVKNFISEENLLKMSQIKNAFRNAPDTVQDGILDALGL